METIEQLKAMRDSARARIEAMPDYKLMTKLTTLIEELEVVFGVTEAPAEASEDTGEEEAAEEEAETAPEASEEPAEDSGGFPGAAPAYEEPVEQQEWEPFEIAEEMVEAEAYVDVPEGQAQADIEETAAYVPAEEGEPEAEEASADDTDIAISQAMAELEADLGNADFEPAPPSRFRYGNSS